jgi:CBS domain-containing protein
MLGYFNEISMKGFNMNVDSLMTPNPYTLKESNTVEDALHLIYENNIRHVPIVDADMAIKGIVSQRDLLQNCSDIHLTLNNIMKKNIRTTSRLDSLRATALLMQKYKIGCLPVVSNGALVGIITDSDFVGIAINLLEQLELAEPLRDDE